MNTSCESMFLLINLELDGEISADEQCELDSHRATCPHCQKLSDDLRQMQVAMGQMEEIAPSEGFKDRVLAQISSETQTKKVVSFRRQWRGVASVAACAVLCIGLFQSGVLPTSDFAMKSADSIAPESAPATTTAAPSAAMPSSEQEMRYVADMAAGDTDAAVTVATKTEDTGEIVATIQERVAEDLGVSAVRWIAVEEGKLPDVLPEGVPPVDQWTQLTEHCRYCKLEENQWQEMRLALGYEVSEFTGDEQCYVVILEK